MIKSVILLGFALGMLGLSLGQARAQAPSIAHGEMRLTFSDEFDALQLWDGASGVWTTTYPWEGVASRTLPTNRELQLYVDPAFAGTASAPLGLNPFSVANGVLQITMARVSGTMAQSMYGYRYASGLLNTRDTFAQAYGYFEIRARLPAGHGFWPAFWLLPANESWPPEIDVFEHLGREKTTIYVGFHSDEAEGGTEPVSAPSATTEFHTYGVLWSREDLIWYMDGVEVHRAPTPPDMHDPMYLLVNFALGGEWAGAPDRQTQFPAHMEVDYVRVYGFEPPAAGAGPGPLANQ